VRATTRAGSRPRLALLLAAVLVAVLGVPAVPADAATKTTKKKAAAKTKKTSKPSSAALLKAQQERAALRGRRVKVAAKLNALKASNSRVEQALRVLNSNVKAQTSAVNDARRNADRASRAAQAARADEKATASDLNAMQALRARVAVRAYVLSPAGNLTSLLGNESLTQATTRRVLLDVVSRSEADVVDQLNALREDLEIQRRLADAADRRARDKQAAYEDRLGDLRTARGQQQRLAAATESRLESALAEAAALSAVDSRLASQISSEQGRLLAQLRASNYKGGGGAALSMGSISVGSTNGIVVAASIRPKLAAMLAAAARSGIYMSGGGYRSSALQVALRRAHCGGSSYAIYQMRASSCRPPTARPGLSMHERGLAIDFTQGGRTLTRGSSGYRWLKANAHKYGFYNLPSEPWHWSTTGR
jgi:hypothetical protein